MALIAGASFSSGCGKSLTCGKGTHEENGTCLPDVNASATPTNAIAPADGQAAAPAPPPPAAHPKITLEEVRKDIIGKPKTTGYTFDADDAHTVKLLDAKYEGDKALVTIDAFINMSEDNGTRRHAYRLHYDWEVGEWDISRVEEIAEP